VGLLCLLALIQKLSENMMKSRRKNTKSPPIICTDDAWFFIATDPPLTIDTLRKKLIPMYANTPSAFWSTFGDHEVYHHETKIGEIFGEGYDPNTIKPTHSIHSEYPPPRIIANRKHLMDTTDGPLSSLITVCREANMEFFPRVRMNSHYVMDYFHASYGNFRRKNPELLIGRPNETIPEGTIEHGIRTGLNYAFLPVREYMYSIITEFFERFDIDGLELDFMRHPAFFRTEEAFRNAYLMTDLIRAIRKKIKEVESERNQKIRLAVRVPPTLEDSRRVGLDIETWISEELVDVVIVGGGFIPFDTPVKDFVDIASKYNIQVYGCIEGLRHIDEKHIRALASLYWQAGASGIYLYNFFTMPTEWNERILNQISNPKNLDKLDKLYELGSTGPFIPTGGHSSAFRHASPSAPLPLALHPTLLNNGSVLFFNITDDLKTSSSDGSLSKCILTLKFEEFPESQELNIYLNNQCIPWNSNNVNRNGWTRLIRAPKAERTTTPTYPVETHQLGISIEYEIKHPLLKQGKNELEIRLSSNTTQSDPIILTGVEINIAYK